MTWRMDDPQGNETSKIHDRLAPYLYGHGLDLGCGDWPLQVDKGPDGSYSCIGVDRNPKATVQASILDLSIFASEKFDYVFSSHALEDFIYTEAALEEWTRLIKPGGRLILYLPLTRRVAKEMGLENWADFYPNKGEEGANFHHQQDLVPDEIKEMVGRCGEWELELEEFRGERNEYSFLHVYRKLSGLRLTVAERPATKRALVVRYGAIGDIIQTVPVLRALKAEGYHVTFNCSKLALEVLAECPYVDRFAPQITDYVPNPSLGDYWKEIAKGYDRFINLTGCVEEKLLPPDSKMYVLSERLAQEYPQLTPQDRFFNVIRHFREECGGKNYYDAHLKAAGIELAGQNGELFFTRKEALMAEAFRARHKGKFIILWSLSGSSYHKWYPYFQTVAQDLALHHPDTLLISVGDPECRLMERAESSRYLPRAGDWTLRTSLVMTKYVDLVIGPETGILNAAGCFPTPKITLLSHSGHDNLCKYWVNDYCLAPENVFCHPCHMLHYVHPVDGTKCHHCQVVHEVPDGVTVPYDGKNGGMWSCPYQNCVPDKPNASSEGAPFPLCMASGIPPARVVKRILEVKEKTWKP